MYRIVKPDAFASIILRSARRQTVLHILHRVTGSLPAGRINARWGGTRVWMASIHVSMRVTSSSNIHSPGASLSAAPRLKSWFWIKPSCFCVDWKRSEEDWGLAKEGWRLARSAPTQELRSSTVPYASIRRSVLATRCPLASYVLPLSPVLV